MMRRKGRNTFTEQLLCPRNCAKCFIVLSYSILKKHYAVDSFISFIITTEEIEDESG